MQAKSIRYKPGGGAELIDLEVGDPGPGQVQLEMAACGICSWDVQTFRIGADGPFPAPPGHEGVAYIRQLGPNVEGFAIGDRVAGGGFAQRCNIAADRLFKLPPCQDDDPYWLVEPVACAVTGVDHCQLKAGERLALVGCGFMGLLILQILARSYADQIIALDIDDSRLDLARQLGADQTYTSAGPELDQIVAELHRRGIDTAIDTSGAQAGLDLASRIVRRGGRINLFGWIKGETAHFNPSVWHTRGITVVNSAPGSKLRDPWPPAIRLLEKGVVKLQPLVSHVIPLAEYPRFMEGVVNGTTKGYVKGVVTP